MKVFKKIQEEKDVVNDVICDVCGKSCMTDYGINAIEIKKYWGYSSKKDLEFWSADICESCVDEKLTSVIPFKKELYNPIHGDVYPPTNTAKKQLP